MIVPRAAVAAILLAVPAISAQAAEVARTERVEAQLFAETNGVQPGGTVTVAFRQKIIPGWHTYWINPGDSGEPTKIAWDLPAGFQAGAIQWPAPQRIAVGPLVNFGYSDEVVLLTDIAAPADARPGTNVTFTANASWLVCEKICVPEDGVLDISLPIVEGAPQKSLRGSDIVEKARAELPRKLPGGATFAVRGETLTLEIADAGVAGAAASAELFPLRSDVIKHAAEQRTYVEGARMVLTAVPGFLLKGNANTPPLTSFEAVVAVTDHEDKRAAFLVTATQGDVAPVAAAAGTGLTLSLPAALAFAFLGGLILNLMPCVFPILSIKALAIANKAGKEAREARALGLSYSAGVVASFVLIAAGLIALRQAGAEIGWGFQLQSPVVVAGLALLFLAIGLNLAGVFEVAFLQSAGAAKTGRGMAGAFATGVLAVAVASPCTAPFMGAAIGTAMTQDAPAAFAIFAALGLGMASPFLLLTYIPGALRFMPKPGPWMARLKEILAFAMFGAAAWLLWVFAVQTGANALALLLAAAVAVAVAAWAIGLVQRGGKNFARVTAMIAILAIAAPLYLLSQAENGEQLETAEAGLRSEPYSPARLAELRAAGRPVFVNLTAAWCITCKLNEAIALSSERVVQAFARAGVVYLKGDWTRRDADITRLLESYGRSGVPLYLYFRPGAERAEILPQILSEETVIEAVENKVAEER